MTPHEHLLAIAAAWREYRAVRDAGGDNLPAIEALSYAIHAGELAANLDPDPVLVEREACARVGRDAVMKFRSKVRKRYYPGYHEDMREAVAAAIRNRSEK